LEYIIGKEVLDEISTQVIIFANALERCDIFHDNCTILGVDEYNLVPFLIMSDLNPKKLFKRMDQNIDRYRGIGENPKSYHADGDRYKKRVRR